MPINNKKKTNNAPSKKVVSKTVKKPVENKPKQPEIVANEFMATIPKVALKKAVDLVSMALPSKEYNDAKSGIFMETKYVDDEPMMFLTANSLNVFIKHGFSLYDDIGEGYVVPDGNSFKKIVSGLQSLSEPIDLSFDEESNIFAINCGDDYESMVQHYDPVGFVLPPSEDDIYKNTEVSMPVKCIIEALDKVAFACSNDSSVPELTGVLMEQTPNSMNFVGADGNRFSYLSINSKVKNPKSVIVGVKYLRLLNNILKALEVKSSDILTLYLSEDKIYFVSDNTIVGVQIFAGEYPIEDGYDRFVIDDDDCELYMHLNVSAFLEKLDLATLHNQSVLEPITLCIESGKKGADFKLKNTSQSSNKFSVEFVASNYRNDTTEKNVQITFTPSYLYDVLKALGAKNVSFALKDISGPVVVKPLDDKDKLYCHVFSLN